MEGVSVFFCSLDTVVFRFMFVMLVMDVSYVRDLGFPSQIPYKYIFFWLFYPLYLPSLCRNISYFLLREGTSLIEILVLIFHIFLSYTDLSHCY